MLEIDGSKKSGSGTILRLAIALAAILGDDLHIFNIRKRRRQPGLRPQHLEAVLTAARLCDADIQGANLNSQELWFRPSKIGGGRIEAEIGTAGSISMLLLTILPICAFANRTVEVYVTKGGTDVRHAPTINYIQHVLLPILNRMGLPSFLRIHRYGYYPKGMGAVTLTVHPQRRLLPIMLGAFGHLEKFRGISVCTFLKERKVADRQAASARKCLAAQGFGVDIDVVYDESNPLQKGSSLVLWIETDSGVLMGGDAIGELRKSSEAVGQKAAAALLTEVKARATVDVHLADILVPYVALASGLSVYLVRSMTTHLATNLWLTQRILDTEFYIEEVKGLYRVESRGNGIL